MIINMTGGGGGGASLNYKVVGGTTAPANPAENTIWVNTDAEITSHVFSASEPESPLEGMVWFSVGTVCGAPINLLNEDNAIYIYPTACMQYVSGAWLEKTAKTYQGGTWSDWFNYIFKAGSGAVVPLSLTEKGGNASFSMTDALISISVSSTSTGYGTSVSTDSPLDLSAYTTIVIDAEISWWQTASGYSGRFGISTSKISGIHFNSYTVYKDFAQGSRQLFTLDISSVSRSAVYVGWSRGFAGKIYNIYYL